ncbi:MAG: MATE family efflux transporter [Polyangiaceae bacterium]
MASNLSITEDAPQTVTSFAELAEEAKHTLKLAWPLALGFIGHNLMGMVDTAMVSRLGKTSLAGVGVANGLFFTLSITGMGIVTGLDPVMSQAVGAKEGARVTAAYRAGLRLVGLLAIPTMLAVLASPMLLPLFGVSAAITSEAVRFLSARAIGVVPFLMFGAFRCTLQTRGVTKPVLHGAILANVVNIALNPLLIFGDGALARVGLPPIGFHGLGVVGSGLASTVATFAQMVVLYRAVRGLAPLEGGGDTDVRVSRIAAIGLPIGLTMLAEIGAFTVVAILAGRIGPEAASGHQVAIQLASITFTATLAVGNATSVRVGQAVGRGDPSGVRRAGWAGLALSALYMSMTSVMFLTLASQLANIVAAQPEIVAVAIPLIHIAAAFQLFDGAQVVASGALRGLGDTKFSQLANTIGYYAIGLPISGALAFGAGLAERGLWWGLCAGLASVAILLVLRFKRKSSEPIVRTG